jgi:pilus assembly protein CpaF
VVKTADVVTTWDGRLVRTDGYPPHADRFACAGIELPRLLEDRR